MTDEADVTIKTSEGTKRIKIISTILMFGAIALQLWSLLAPLPEPVEPIAKITGVVLIIHAVEGLISSLLILRYRLAGDPNNPPSNTLLAEKLPSSTPLAVIKAGLYAFFVGTVGLVEVIEATTSLKSAS